MYVCMYVCMYIYTSGSSSIDAPRRLLFTTALLLLLLLFYKIRGPLNAEAKELGIYSL